MAEHEFDPAALTKAAEDAFTVRRVFGEAYERDGVTVIPVARVLGLIGMGAGGGKGKSAGLPAAFGGRWRAASDEAGGTPADAPSPSPEGEGEGHGGGGGYGACVKPIGVYVVDGAGVRWNPVVDWTLLALGALAAGAWVATIGVAGWAVRRR